MYGIKWYRQAGVRMYLIEIVTSYDISQQFNTQSSQLPYYPLQLRVPAEYRRNSPRARLVPEQSRLAPCSHQGSYQTSTRVSSCRQSLFELIQQRKPTN